MLHLVGCLYYLYQWCTVKQITDNEIYMFIQYIKSVLWRVGKLLSYIQDARCLKVKLQKWNLQIRGVRCTSAAYIKVNPLGVRKLSQMLPEPWRYWHTKRTDKRKCCETSVLTYGRLKQTYWFLGKIVS